MPSLWAHWRVVTAMAGPLSLGVCMAEREFVCVLCGKIFRRVSGDLLLPPDQVCDDCLAEFEPLEESELWEVINRRRQEMAQDG